MAQGLAGEATALWTMKLLVVEDDAALRRGLLRLLGQWGLAAEGAASLGEARGWLERDAFDLLVLDLGLPDGDGVSLCRELRRRAGHQPLVLMLTARDDRRETVRGLEEGADDYVVKPFDPELLRARLRSLLRRAHLPLLRELAWGPLHLPAGQTSLRVNGAAVELTRKEALLLELLLRARGGSLSKAELLHGCGDGRREVGEDALRAHMRNLRQKLTLAGCDPNLIETVYGVGYRLSPAAAA